MLIGIANIILPSSSSSGIPGSRALTIIRETAIKFCIIGISSLPLHWLHHIFSNSFIFK